MGDQRMLTAVCPECARVVAVEGGWAIGHLLLCPHCEMILTVKSVDPPQLDWVFEAPSTVNGRYSIHFFYNPHWHF